MTHKKVLVADRIAKEGIDVLRDKGYDVDVKLDLTEDELAAQIAPYDAIVVRSATPVTRRVIEAAENLKIIGRAGVGVDTIDLDAATERGVIVCNAPTSNIMSAAEHTMALMLACAPASPGEREHARGQVGALEVFWARSSMRRRSPSSAWAASAGLWQSVRAPSA